MQQAPLFHEDIYAALRTDVGALGGPKKVGHALWPTKSADKAGENLNNCLNTTRNEKLDPEQVQFIVREARKIGSFATATYQNSDAGFAPPVPIEPEDEAAKLMREFNQSVEIQRQIMQRMERINLPTVKGVA